MFRRMMLVVAALLLVAVSVQAAMVGPIAKGPYSMGGITLTTALPSWSANLATDSSFMADVYNIIGIHYTGDTTKADVTWGSTDDDGYGFVKPYVLLGRDASNSNNAGSVVYRFVLPSGYTTGTGGTVSAQTQLYGDGLSWVGLSNLGISPIFGLESGSYSNIDPAISFVKDSFDTPTPGGWGLASQTLTVSIPVGVSEFYVALRDEFGTYNRIAFNALSVNANIVPEPATMILLGLGSLALIRRK